MFLTTHLAVLGSHALIDLLLALYPLNGCINLSRVSKIASVCLLSVADALIYNKYIVSIPGKSDSIKKWKIPRNQRFDNFPSLIYTDSGPIAGGYFLAFSGQYLALKAIFWPETAKK